MLYAFFDDFQFLLFDFLHLSSFNARGELDHLIILYHPVPSTHEYWGGAITMVAPPLTCLKFGQLIIRKIIRIVATRCQILGVKMYKIRCQLGLCPRPHLGAYSAPSLV